jgi:hypothetical protein
MTVLRSTALKNIYGEVQYLLIVCVGFPHPNLTFDNTNIF